MIPYGKHHIDEDDIQAVVDVLRSGILTQGPSVGAFERAIANYVGAKHAVALSSGTAALHLAALVAGIEPGRTLITSPNTFVASANAGIYAAGEVAFADIDPLTLNMSPQALELAISANPGTRAIVPVHFAGLPCDMTSIKAMADGAGAAVIEDAAHALGAKYSDGRRVGCCAHSLMTIFSFHPVKAIAAGEGGMITTNDEAVYRRLISLRSHGISKLGDPQQWPAAMDTNVVRDPWYYEMQEIGFHYRISDLQCGLALSQFKKIEKFMERRRYLVKRYDAAFSSMKCCRPGQSMGRDQSGHHLYVLRIDFESIGQHRGDLMRALKARGIGSQVHYIPVPSQPFYRRMGHNPDLYPNAQNYYREALSIPLFYDLSDTQQDLVIQAIKELVG